MIRAIIDRNKLWIILVLGVTLFGLAGCVGDLAQLAQKNLYAFAHANKESVPSEMPTGYEEVNLEVLAPIEPGDSEPQTDKLSINTWAYPVDQFDAPVIVYAHGNAVNIGGLYSSGFFEKIASYGVHVVIYDYPSYGKSTGTPTERSLIAASEAALDWVQNRFPKSRILFWGRSLGAGVAVQTVFRNQQIIDAFMLTSPWHLLNKLMKHHVGDMANDIPEEWTKKNTYNSLDAAAKILIPGVVVHGTKDDTIPFNFGKLLFAAFPTTKTNFISIVGKGHNDLYGDPFFWQEFEKFISR